MRIVINGIGVAGPALAYWLTRTGHEVLLVETAPRLRSGGYVVDFWGVGYDVVERMGLIDEVRGLGYQVHEVRVVDRLGKKSAGLDVDVFHRVTRGRFTSVRRSDISATMYRAVENKVETIFGDSVASIDQEGSRVHVKFDHAPPRDVDLVIGADGLHSRVRRLAFAPQEVVEVPLGYHIAAFEVEGYPSRDELVYVSHSLPGRQIARLSLRDDRTMCLLIFRDEYMDEMAEPKALMHRVFAGAGWEWPEIATAMDRADEIYFDTVAQIHMPRWTNGRVALVGDAGACVSVMAGEGTGLAIFEAYVLAGELHAAGGDVARAFAQYEQRLMPFVRAKQRSAAKFASSIAPATSLGLHFRTLAMKLMRIPGLADFAIGRSFRDEIESPDYRM